MIPLLEWLTKNWDALFHEEQLPLKNVGRSAAEAMALTRTPPISLKEVDEFEWLGEWTAWWDRHNLRSAREGGLFPDLYMRRYRSSFEISTGAETLIGIPEEFAFLAPHRRYEVDLDNAARRVGGCFRAMGPSRCGATRQCLCRRFLDAHMAAPPSCGSGER
ncbi:hypothetical protein RM780_10665 [Streptomyces sp. DSM 44917]|uniref:Uncharacterized protein n=1 Tax=Streptomyces boetiae TaxID=3075541 RepID=A0ABU2L7E2_9ACTN|nr:hypothetical protein [Streptomyces sp. DSM 44917]MDT0307425.1 hypothetical protein [Streptomyces sp. DSM 44917]